MFDCRDVIKTVVFGQHKKPRAPRLRKFTKRCTMLTPRRSPLSPIVENPFETELMKHNRNVISKNECGCKLESVMECISPDVAEDPGTEVFNEELKRLQKISLDEMQFPSPAKRRKLTSCGIESKIDQDVCNMLTSPIKPLPV